MTRYDSTSPMAEPPPNRYPPFPSESTAAAVISLAIMACPPSYGFSTSEIAHRLTLSPHAVRDYLKQVFEKVGVSSRGELVAKVFAEHYGSRLDAGILDSVVASATHDLVRRTVEGPRRPCRLEIARDPGRDPGAAARARAVRDAP